MVLLYLFSNAIFLSKKAEVLFYFILYSVLQNSNPQLELSSTILIFSMKNRISYQESDYLICAFPLLCCHPL